MYALTFSYIINGQRVPLIIDDREHTMNIEASSKTEAIYKPEVATFCTNQANGCRVRGVR